MNTIKEAYDEHSNISSVSCSSDALHTERSGSYNEEEYGD
jgi:hypothetical protein